MKKPTESDLTYLNDLDGEAYMDAVEKLTPDQLAQLESAWDTGPDESKPEPVVIKIDFMTRLKGEEEMRNLPDLYQSPYDHDLYIDLRSDLLEERQTASKNRYGMYFLWFIAGLFCGYLWMGKAFGMF